VTTARRVAAISDIHGNLPALEAVLADVEREGIETIVVPGDTISGPWAAEVFDLVKEAGGLVVRGNADREVIERSDRHGPLARWSADRMGDERLAFAASWPLTLELEVAGLGTVLVCHSTPDSEDPIYTSATPDDEVRALFGDVDAQVVLCGHTHMQYDRLLGSGLRIVNPGSIGMPYEGTRGAFWATLGPSVELRRTDYDVEAAAAAIEVIGAPVDERFVEYLLEPPDPVETTTYFESLRGT
jgi:putative phosphoesterase